MKQYNLRRKKVIFAAALMSGCMLFLFQNCSKGFAVKYDISSKESILDYARKLDLQYLPALTMSDNISYWEDDAGLIVDNMPTFATDWSMVAVINNTTDGSLVSVNSGAGSEESNLSISGGKLTLNQIGDSSNYAISTFANNGFNPTTVIAFSSGPKMSNAIVLVDGYLQIATPQSAGADLDFSLLAKTLDFNTSRIKEIVFYPRALSASELNVMSRHLAQKYSLTTVVLDPAVIDAGGGGGSSESPEALAAIAVINNRCLNCHSSSNNGDFRGLTTSKAVQKQLVSPRNLVGSKIYYRLSGASVGPGPRNMPTDGAIPQSEVEAIEAWILSIQ